MKEQIVVTIGRSFGSNGKFIGEKLAKDLGLEFYDRNLIDLMSEKTGVARRKLADGDEKLLNWMADLGLGRSGDNPNEQLYQAQSEIIRNLVKQRKSCVFVGRMADYVLRNRPDVLKVFIYAPMEERIETVMNRYNFRREEAIKVIRRVDKDRRRYYEYFTDNTWDQKEGKTLMIDSSIFGIDGSVEIIKKALEVRQYKAEYNDIE